MLAVALCVIAFLLTLSVAHRSLASGLGVLLAVGYFHGILRANVPASFSTFIFDAALFGFYAARLLYTLTPLQRFQSISVRPWLIPLIGWPVFITLLPLQDYLIQLVGLRANAFMVFLLIFGTLLGPAEWMKLALWISVLNLLALSFGTAEYFRGIEQFYPVNEVTQIIYASGDVTVGDELAFRIPAIFSNAHSFGGAMAGSLPIVLSALFQPGTAAGRRWILAAGSLAAVLGCLMCAARLPVIVMGALFVIAVYSLRRNKTALVASFIAIVGFIVLIETQERFQRFLTLTDTEMIETRVAGSVNAGFLEILWRYPFGNGMGSGGTSIPYFLENRLKQSLIMENDYARMQLELGLPGLLMWIAFLLATIFRRSPHAIRFPSGQALRRNLYRGFVLTSFATAAIGLGLFTSIPSTALLFLQMGWLHQCNSSGKNSSGRSRQALDQTTRLPSTTPASA